MHKHQNKPLTHNSKSPHKAKSTLTRSTKRLSTTNKKIKSKHLHHNTHHLFSTTTPTTPTSTKPQDDEEEGLEIIRSSPKAPQTTRATPAAVIPTQPKKQSTKSSTSSKQSLHYNTAYPHDSIPPEGVVIFEHKARGWLQAIPPMATAMAIGMPIFTGVASYMSNFSPEVMVVFGCATASALFASYQAYKFTQSHVHLVRLKQDNLIEFETSGFFGYKKFLTYPANFIYPLIADPSHGMFGFKVKFLPLIQEMEREAGALRAFDSGLVISPDTNVKTGNPKTCWNNLIGGSVAFHDTESNSNSAADSRRKVAAMV